MCFLGKTHPLNSVGGKWARERHCESQHTPVPAEQSGVVAEPHPRSADGQEESRPGKDADVEMIQGRAWDQDAGKGLGETTVQAAIELHTKVAARACRLLDVQESLRPHRHDLFVARAEGHGQEMSVIMEREMKEVRLVQIFTCNLDPPRQIEQSVDPVDTRPIWCVCRT